MPKMFDRKKPLILIVDDTPKNIQVLGKTLHEIGYNVSIATSGSQALDSVKKESPDLILLDIQMPEMDGFEVCKILQANPDTKEIPVIFLTAVIDSEKIVKGFEIGAVDYITKPFHTAELTMRVATHIEIKQSREKIRKTNEQLKELNATKDKFFSIIAHDLKNPFNTLLGFSKLLFENAPNYTTDQIQQYAQIMNHTAKQSYALLENLMQWAKSQTEKIKIIPRNSSMNELLSITIPIINGSALKKNITIESNISTEDIVYADNSLTATILRNLLTNAIKFTHANGKITVSTQKKDIFLEVSITDTGVGIEPMNIDKLFRIDSKVTSHGTDNEEGTGLGLILCKEFVEKQGGTIWAISEVGKGSTFTFTLPLAETKS
ncbi:MAG: hybrid sensor histidine kinase/response regulator [Leptospiraceae bacterium]|nr:hybrid sensor histidine kinase/response regulator [Leptospiraceae bacterium]